jgi:uncharacterized repeat protein (TIGR02543 family)
VQRSFRKVTVLLISLSLGFVPSAYASQSEPASDAKGAPTAKIVGGSAIDISQAPWQVALIGTSATNNKDGFFCGGSIISTDWIVTAAHCLVDGATVTEKSEILVLAGNANLSQTGPVTGSAVEKILISPEWNSNTFAGDIALVQLVTPLTLIPGQIEKIGIPGSEPSEGTLAYISGWGSTWFSDGYQDYPELSNYTQQWPTDLQGATVVVGSYSSCSSVLGEAFLMYSMLCAGTQDYLNDSCQGDSGGPLATTSGGLWYLSGIVSFGYGCAWTTPGVYTDVAFYKQWISAQTFIDTTPYDGTSGIVPCETSGSVTGAGYIIIEQKILTSNNGCAGAVNIPEGVTSIEDPLDESQIVSLSIPASLSSLPDVTNDLFGHEMTSITVAAGNANYSSIAGVLFNNDATKLIFYPGGKSGTSYTIPSSVLTIGEYAFFSEAALTSIVIPASVTLIENLAFYGADELRSYSVSPNNLSYFSSADSIIFNKNSTTLIAYPAARTGASYTIPSTVTSIGDFAFSGASVLEAAVIPKSVASIAMSSFYSADSLTRITVASDNANYASVEGVLFDKTSTSLLIYPASKAGTSYVIPASVTSLGEYAFNVYMDWEGETSALANVYFLGNAPDTFTTTFDLQYSAKAYKREAATGFIPDAQDAQGRWNGLFLTTGYPVTYDANGASSGTAPNDSIPMYGSGESVSVLSNSGQLAKTNYIFSGWNTASNGSGTTYEASGSDSFIIGAQSVKLYATWTLDPAYVAAQDAAAKAQADAAAKAQADAAAQAVAAELASRTVGAKKKFAAKSLAQQTGVVIVSPKAKVTFKVAKSSKKVCTKSGSKLKTLSAGTCVVTFTVQEPKPKKGKKPKATKTVKTFVVQ